MRWPLIVAVTLAGCGRLSFERQADRDAASDSVDGSPTDGDASVCGGRAVGMVPDSGRLTLDTATLTDDATGTCGGAGQADAIYAIDVPAGASLLVAADLPSGTVDTLLHVRRDCADPSTEVACDTENGVGDNAAYRLLTPGAGRYYVFLDRDGTAAGQLDATIQVLLPQGAVCIPGLDREICGPELACTTGTCQPAGCPAPMVIPIAATGMTSYTIDTTTGTRSHAGSCGQGVDGGVRAQEQILRIDLAIAGSLRISTDDAATTYDTLVYLRDACAGTEIVCDDDGGADNLTSVVTTPVLSAGSYFLFIDGFAYKTGTARLTLTLQ